jgi:carbonic anhydrase
MYSIKMLQKYNNNLEDVTPQAALEILLDGNQRFLNGISVNKDLLSKVEMTGKQQKPFAAILSCMDSRAPVELLFDQGIGDVFSVRMAGNITSDNVLGSLEYAAAVAGAKLIMVMGHTNCGAVKGAIEQVKMGNLTQLLEKIEPAVQEACALGFERDSSNKDFVDKVTDLNVNYTIASILEQSEVIKKLVEDGAILLVGAQYCVETGTVTLLNQDVLA